MYVNKLDSITMHAVDWKQNDYVMLYTLGWTHRNCNTEEHMFELLNNAASVSKSGIVANGYLRLEGVDACGNAVVLLVAMRSVSVVYIRSTTYII